LQLQENTEINSLEDARADGGGPSTLHDISYQQQ
jgi:hypothetical protein